MANFGEILLACLIEAFREKMYSDMFFFFFLFTKRCKEFCNKILEYEKRATKLPKISHLVIVR